MEPIPASPGVASPARPWVGTGDLGQKEGSDLGESRAPEVVVGVASMQC